MIVSSGAVAPEHLSTISELVTAGKLRPVVYREYPLSELPAALEAIETRSSYGKIVLVP